jgi:hypothetical protein
VQTTLITLVLCAAPSLHDPTGMPQECYNPRYGCYFCGRFAQRYPAFHGYDYRAPYNYRHYYEYPWCAARHTPQPYVLGDIRAVGVDESIAPEPVPVPMPALEFSQTRAMFPQRVAAPSAPRSGPWIR